MRALLKQCNNAYFHASELSGGVDATGTFNSTDWVFGQPCTAFGAVQKAATIANTLHDVGHFAHVDRSSEAGNKRWPEESQQAGAEATQTKSEAANNGTVQELTTGNTGLFGIWGNPFG
jgi:hypothetical protein